MSHSYGELIFKQVAAELKDGRSLDPLSVRDLLNWFGAQRRSFNNVQRIERALEQAGLETEPDFQNTSIDSEITLRIAGVGPTSGQPEDFDNDEDLPDPTYRIGFLASANRKPISVAPDHPVQVASTLMLANDFSQLPVMTDERTVKGVVSWTSLGSCLSLQKSCTHVRDCMDPAKEISADASLFEAISRIVENQYVLIRNRSNQICGIVTTSDLSLQFQQLAEPFLLIGEIENYVRKIIRKVPLDTLSLAKDSSDSVRIIEGVSDLTFGEYERLLQNPTNWAQLDLPIDRAVLTRKLGEIRNIRNDVMHFNSDGIDPDDLSELRQFASFLQKLAHFDVI